MCVRALIHHATVNGMVFWEDPISLPTILTYYLYMYHRWYNCVCKKGPALCIGGRFGAVVHFYITLCYHYG